MWSSDHQGQFMALSLRKKKKSREDLCMRVLISFSKIFLALDCNSPSRHTFKRMHTVITRDISPASTSNALVTLNSIPAQMKAQGSQKHYHVIFSGWPLCIKVLTRSSGLRAASFFHPRLLKLPPTPLLTQACQQDCRHKNHHCKIV